MKKEDKKENEETEEEANLHRARIYEYERSIWEDICT